MRNSPDTLATIRDPAVDLVKVIAMIMVVGLHCSWVFVRFVKFDKLGLAMCLYDLCLPAVPLFFMASGFLLLGRKPEHSGYGYALRKVVRILRFFAIYICCAYGLTYIFGDPPYNLWDTIRYSICGVSDFYYLWFLIALAIVYLFYPLLNRLWHRPRAALVMIHVAVLALVASFFTHLFTAYELHVWQFLRLWYWLGFFILGGAMHRIMLSRGLLCAMLIVLCAARIFAIQFIYGHFGMLPGEHFYGSPLSILICCTIFLLCLDSDIRPSRAMTALSQLFLPVYVLHVPVLGYLLKYMPWTEPGACVGLSCCTLVITLFISWLLMRIRPIRALFTL